MTNVLATIQNEAHRFQAELSRLQGKAVELSHRDLESLTRRSQRVAIRCRELWANCLEDNFTPGIEAPTPGCASMPDWAICIHHDSVVEITIPLLLPKRTCPDTIFITEPLELLLCAYQADLPRFRRCYVVFRHIYGPGMTVRDIRDHDNIESRKVLNTIERYLLTSDSGYYCTNIHQTAMGVTNKTVILLAGSPNHLEGVLQDAVT